MVLRDSSQQPVYTNAAYAPERRRRSSIRFKLHGMTINDQNAENAEVTEDEEVENAEEKKEVETSLQMNEDINAETQTVRQNDIVESTEQVLYL